MTAQKPTLILLGVGKVATALARHVAGSHQIYGTSRHPAKLVELEKLGIRPIMFGEENMEQLAELARDAFVLVSFPPDGITDKLLAPTCKNARSLIYISSTGVYGNYSGVVDDTTLPDSLQESFVDPEDPQIKLRLEAESIWRTVGGIVIRPPGFYGPDYGLHIRLKEQSFQMAGNGLQVVSRIHLDDLAEIILAAFATAPAGRTYVVGDLNPVPQIEVVKWLCNQLNLSLPPFQPASKAHPTLRAGRAVNPRSALSELGVKLRYPTYKEGFSACLGQSP